MPTFEGGRACGAVRYRLEREPLIVHCCHCTRCQTETGSAFALNAVIEASAVQLLAAQPEGNEVPTTADAHTPPFAARTARWRYGMCSRR